MANPVTKYASDLPDFRDLLRAVADSKRQRSAIVEKDYYLCRALHALSAGHAGEFILFEAGYRGSADAAVKRTIRSMVAEYAKDKGQQDLAEDLRDFEIELQDLRRTFVEKLFAIHAAYAKDLANNRMRHYYDLSRLCGVEEIQSYVGTGAYRACVADVKGICRDSFPDQAVPEGDSFKDSRAFQVSETFAELERNYKREAEIFFSEPPKLKAIFEEIKKVRPKL